MVIYAFVVTYNRLELLKRTIECLRKQTEKIDKIIIINNSSTDGTGEWLETQPDLHVITQPNLGGAGGFNTGVKYSVEDGADWIWMMDDDVFPEDNCLEIMLRYKDYSECIHPSRIYKDGLRVNWGYNFSLENYKLYNLDYEKLSNEDYFEVNVGCFEGMLISRKIVSQIGFPDPRFFISGDDQIYGYLASHYTSVISIRDAILFREMLSTERKYSPMYNYYTYRNFHIFEEYYTKETGCKRYSYRVHIRHILGTLHGILILLTSSASNKRQMIFSTFRGVLDSFRKITGKSY